MKVPNQAAIDRIGVSIVQEKFTRLGYVFREQPIVDCGIDAQIELLENGSATGKLVALQIKSGQSWFKKENDHGYVFYGDFEHLEYWLNYSLKVLIVICDVEKNECYWQAIVPKNISRTTKLWKILIPKTHLINAGMDVDLKRLVEILPVHNNFTICSIGDTTHGVAKRYSVKIILNREHTQDELIDLIKSQTAVTKNCEYHRSDIVRNKWMGTPAHVVWLFIYPTAEDQKRNNFICRTEWISSELPEKFSPISNGGESIGDDIKVVWNNDYLNMSKFYSENTVEKESFVSFCRFNSNQIADVMGKIKNIIREYENKEITYNSLIKRTRDLYSGIDKINETVNGFGLASFECSDLSQKMQQIVCLAHNVFIPFSSIGNLEDEKHVIYNMKSQSQYYYEEVPSFEMELKKIE